MDTINQRYKYPRTPHIPGSPGCTSDDKVLSSLDQFKGKQVVITEKMDGENTTLYSDYLHARSIDSRHHPSRNWIKAFHSQFAHNIPKDWRFCGENMYATHSIAYDNLDNYFYVFSVWEKEFCVDWDYLEFVCDTFSLIHVPVLYKGLFNEQCVHDTISNLDTTKTEGFVIRTIDGFWYNEFDQCVAKYVRAKHVQTDEHWMTKTVIPNKLRNQI